MSEQDIYAEMDEQQWNQSPATQSADDRLADEPLAVADDEREPEPEAEATPEEGGTIVQAETPQGTDVAVALETVGRTETGDVVVGSAAALNSGAANDAKTEDGIGQEFGVWGEGAKEYIHIKQGHVLPVPDGSSKVGIERIAGRERELQDIHDRYYGAATEGGEFVIPSKRREIAERLTERAEESRDAVQRRDMGQDIQLAFDRYDDEAIREQARADTEEPHRTYHSRHLERSVRRQPDRWADETRDAPTPLVDPSEVPDTSDREPSEWAGTDRLDELTMEVADRVLDTPAGDALGLSIRDVREQTKRALEDSGGDALGALLAAARDLFHPQTQPLTQVEPWWTSASVRVRVEELYVPHSSSQRQVAKVSDVAPTVEGTSIDAEHAKVTIWKRSDVDATLAEGDIVELRNVKPGKYGKQLTLAVTSDTSVIRRHRGDGPKTTWWDGLEISAPSRPEGEPPEAFQELPTGQLTLPRYRQPHELGITEELGWDESVAAQGASTRKHRDTGHEYIEWVFDPATVPDWFAEREHVVHLARRRAATEAVTSPDEFDAPAEGAQASGDTSEAIPRAKMVEVIRLFNGEWEVADHLPTSELVVQAPIPEAPGRVVRVYTSVVGQWARPRGKDRIHVTVEAPGAGDIQTVQRINRTEGWHKRLAAAVRTAFEQAGRFPSE